MIPASAAAGSERPNQTLNLTGEKKKKGDADRFQKSIEVAFRLKAGAFFGYAIAERRRSSPGIGRRASGTFKVSGPNQPLQQTGPASRLFETQRLCSRPRC